MAEPQNDEFYTGYLSEAPPGIARRVRAAVIALFILAVAVAGVLIAGQKGFSAAVYEFGTFRDFEGVVEEKPYPTLTVERPGHAGDTATSTAAASRLYLVGPGKLGAEGVVEGLDGQRVKLHGSLLYRDDQTMVEVVPESVAATAGAPSTGTAEASLGSHTLTGRIVDSKCFLGIMKPGATKPHRACATRCIAGGIPPLFVVSDAEGPAAYLMLVGTDGRAVNQEILELIDEPLEITGEVTRLDDLMILKADPASYRRLL